MGLDLTLIWFVIIVFGVLMYIIMDGFDLGIGILMPLVENKQHRDDMVNSVAPVWDGNETWLVLGGAALFGAFPLAYAVVLEALMMPLGIMLIALIFRGVAFEFRFQAVASHRGFWDKSFMVGSALATFSQGVVVGALVQGIAVTERHFSGGIMDWLTPFSLFCGVGLLLAYALLGSTWLMMKTHGDLHRQAQNWSRKLSIGLLLAMAVVSVWTPLLDQVIATRWFSLPNTWFFLPVPVLVIAAAWGIHRAIANDAHHLPFLLTLGLIFLGFSGLGISIWPNIIPPHISIWQAASSLQSQGFMVLGTLLIVPIILMYTAWSYYVFRGKVEGGYGH